MDNIVVRTDLAVEANEEAMNGTGKLRGIRLRESNKSRMGVKVTELQVTNHLGEAAIGRPKGTYLTIEADDITGGDEEYAKEVISTLTGYIFKLLKRMNKNVKPEKILVIGLGNRNIKSDSLGPEVVDNICIKISEGDDLRLVRGKIDVRMSFEHFQHVEIVGQFPVAFVGFCVGR